MMAIRELPPPNLRPKSPAPNSRSSGTAIWAPGAFAVVTDALLIALTFLGAYWLRYSAQLFIPVEDFNQVDFDDYIPFMVGYTVVMLGSLYVRGLYRPRLDIAWAREVGDVFNSTTTATILLITATYLFRPYSYSRLMFIYVWAIPLVLLIGWRTGARLYQQWQWRRGIGRRRVAIVGSGLQGRLIMQSMLANSTLGYEIVGFLDADRTDPVGRFQWLGHPNEITEVVADHGVEEVIIALPSTSHAQILAILAHCHREDVEFRIVPDFFDLSLDRVGLKYIDGIPLIGLHENRLRGFNLVIKRAMDLVIAGVLLVPFGVIGLICAIAIKVEDRGPVLYSQMRVGRNGKLFKFFKFRTMHVDADKRRADLLPIAMDGARFKVPDDPRRTRVGSLLRRYSLDEIPQLLNVVKGDMSLVGPRPPLPDEAGRYDDWSNHRLSVSPGVTGVWQVSGRSDLPFEEMVLLDRWYIENWSLALDLSILIRTIPAVLSGRGAY